jgi:hypothetical protein
MLSKEHHTSLPLYGEFVEISQHHTSIPLGWDELGTLFAENYSQFLLSLEHTHQEENPFKDIDMQAMLNVSRTSSSCVHWYVCFARKPFTTDEVADRLEQTTLDSIYEFVEGFHDDDF